MVSAKPVADWIRSASVKRFDLATIGDEAFTKLEEQVRPLSEQGVKILWLTAVFPLSYIAEQPDRSEPYPIKDYYEVDERYGTLEDLRSLVRTVHESGMRVLLDVAMGYTAWDSKLLMEQPDWFVTNDEGGIVSPSAAWQEIGALNYRHHELRKYMIEVLKFWVRDVGVDGFVCQLADLVPSDFWLRARKELEKLRPVLLIADSDHPEHHVEAFDASVDFFAVFEMERTSPGALYRFSPVDAIGTVKFPRGSLRLVSSKRAVAHTPQSTEEESRDR
jgi:cyclomaltodextrinase